MFSFKITPAVAFAILCATAQAAPNALNNIALFNGDEVVSASIEKREGFSLLPRDSFSCKGSSLCGSGGLTGDCDAAKRIIDAQHNYVTGAGVTQSGVCTGRCGIFVENANCDLTGQEMIDGYNQIRANGCKTCGSKTFGDGCRLTVNYVTGC